MKHFFVTLLFGWVALAGCGADHDHHHHHRRPKSDPRDVPARMETAATLTPQRMSKDADWSQAIAGPGYVCGLKQAGSLWCAGNNDKLQFGVETDTPADEFLRVGNEYWANVAVGRRGTAPFACGVTRGGKLQCWGYGVAEDVPSEPAVAKSLATQWAQVSSGARHVCGVTQGGDLACFGENGSAQLGITSASKNTPVVVDGSGNWVQTSAGATHTCGIQADGALFCWGNPMQTGANGTLTEGPTRISAAAAWGSVAAGDTHTCALRTDGTLWCWGSGESGQLGIGITNERWLIPVQVGSDSNWAEVAVGANHTCALKESGQLYCWGANEHGQLGHGGRLLRDKPALVQSAYAWKSIALHENQTCAVRSDGSLWCWGQTISPR